MGKASRRRQSLRVASESDRLNLRGRVNASGMASLTAEAHRIDLEKRLQKTRLDFEKIHGQRVELVDQLRALGASWAVIGALLGVSAQAAQQKYGRA